MTSSLEIVAGALAGGLAGVLAMHVLKAVSMRIGEQDAPIGRLVVATSVLRLGSFGVGGLLILAWGVLPGIAFFGAWLVARTVYVERVRRAS